MTIETLTLLLFQLLSLHGPDTRPCTDPYDCVGLAGEIAEAVDTAHAIMPSVPAKTLVTIAWYESGLDQDRHGRLGQGLFGINPRTPLYQYVRDQCDLHPGDPQHCLTAQALGAARYLDIERRRLGSWKAAIEAYGAGYKGSDKGKARYLAGYRRARRTVERMSSPVRRPQKARTSPSP